MSLPFEPRCCPVCGGIFPIPRHYGLHSPVYCEVPDHWEAVGLDADEMIQSLEEFQQRQAYVYEQRAAAFREAMARIQQVRRIFGDPLPPPELAAKPPNTTDADLDEDREAKVRRLLRWLIKPPDIFPAG